MTEGWAISVRATRLAVLLIWLACVAGLVILGRHSIEGMILRDPDDAMRLVEVRDWMAGQSWFDVTQYRSHPPMGAPMHWSRLVDVPIAAVMALAGLFTAPEMAERIALLTVPFLTLLALFVTLAVLTVRATGRRDAALLSVLILLTSAGVLVQFQPLRIDHHGWQILLGTLATCMVIGPDRNMTWRGALAGAVMALSLIIAVEGLPLAVTLGAVLGLRTLWRAEHGVALVAYLLALLLMSGSLLLGTLGWPASFMIWCDSLSPAYIVPLGATTLVLLIGRGLVPQHGLTARAICMILAGMAGAGVYFSYSHVCLAGPFATLDPVVYRLWYVNVAEGMPIWAQSPDLRIMILLPGLLGLIGTLLAIRYDAPARRDNWIVLLIVQAATFAVAMLVMRAMGIAHVVAIPGNAWLFIAAFQRAMRFPRPQRVLIAVSCFILTPPGAEAMMSILLSEPSGESDAGSARSPACMTYHALRRLDALPATTLFTPLDIGPKLLVYTHHSVVATAHHRNAAGIKAVVTGLTATPDVARPIVMATPARYLAFCRDENEGQTYAKRYPRSLMADLLHNRVPAWLQPVPMRRGEGLRVYRILRSDQVAVKRIATPFMQ
jgi:hypothetical protein